MENEIEVFKKETLTKQAKTVLKRTAQDIVELSQICHKYRESFGYQEYVRWIKEDLGLSEMQGSRLLNVFEKFGATNIMLVDEISPTTLYLLSAPSTPESARTEALERAESGENITTADAKQLIEAHKQIEEQNQKIAGLEKSINSLKGQLPTNDVLKKIVDLEAELKAEKAKPAQTETVEVEKIIIKPPEDYKEAKLEAFESKNKVFQAKADLDLAQKAKAEIEEKLRKLKVSKEKDVNDGIEREKRKLQDEFDKKQGQINTISKRIEHLKNDMQEWERRSGQLSACTDTHKRIQNALLEISIHLRDFFEDYEVPEQMEPKMRKLATDMIQGGQFFQSLLDDKPILKEVTAS